jgi:presqualene diphosphate synthase
MSEQAAIDMSGVAAAQDHVADVVVKARTSFYWAMRLLPAEKRQAMFAVYAFCRVVDDIADGDLPPATKLQQLQGWREEIDRLYAGKARHPIARALVEPVRHYDLAREDFLAIIDGMEMDGHAPLVAPSMAELELYCARVAGAVGLLSVRIFGAPREGGIALARALGEAVQLTNILRDLDEDAGLGRLYLPRELLEKHGVPTNSPAAALRHPQLPPVCDELAGVAQRRFDEAPHRRDAAAAAQAGAHHHGRLSAVAGAAQATRLHQAERAGVALQGREALARAALRDRLTPWPACM